MVPPPARQEQMGLTTSLIPSEKWPGTLFSGIRRLNLILSHLLKFGFDDLIYMVIRFLLLIKSLQNSDITFSYPFE